MSKLTRDWNEDDKQFAYDGRNVVVTRVMEAYSAHVNAELVATLEKASQLFAKGHAIDHFNWGNSFLNADDIRELNELPIQIRGVLAKYQQEEKK